MEALEKTGGEIERMREKGGNLRLFSIRQPSCNCLTLMMFTITVIFGLLCTNFYIL